MRIRALSGWAQDTTILLFSQGTTVAVTWALSILVARQLGPAEFGIFTACLGAAIAAAVLVDLGLGRWLLRELSALFVDPETSAGAVRSRASALLGPAVRLWFLLAGALVGGVTVFALLMRFSQPVAIALILLVAYTALTSLATLLEVVFRAQRRVRLVALATIFEKVVLAAGVAAVLTRGLRIDLLGIAYVAAGAARVAFDWLPLKRAGIRLVESFRMPVRQALRASLPFFLTASAFTMVTRVDPVVIALGSTIVAGYYGVGERVLGLLLFIPMTAATTLFPHLSGVTAGTRTGVYLTGILTAISSLLALGMVVAAPAIVPILYGDAFTGSVILVQLMVAALPAIAMASGLTVTLFARRREWLVSSLNVSLMLLGSAGLALGTELGGTTGAGLAYLCRAWALCAVLLVVTLKAGSRARDAPVPYREPQRRVGASPRHPRDQL